MPSRRPGAPLPRPATPTTSGSPTGRSSACRDGRPWCLAPMRSRRRTIRAANCGRSGRTTNRPRAPSRRAGRSAPGRLRIRCPHRRPGRADSRAGRGCDRRRVTMYQYFKLGCAALLAAWLAGCGSDSGPERGSLVEPAAGGMVTTLTAAQIDAATAASGLQAISGVAQCDVEFVSLTYRTLGARGEDRLDATNDPIQVSGVLLLPAGACAETAAPLLAYARGTEVRKPRTLANPQDAEAFLLAAMYAAQGYAVVASDYLGYAKSNYPFHPYLHADSEATTVIDAIRAARNAAEELGAPLNGQ